MRKINIIISFVIIISLSRNPEIIKCPDGYYINQKATSYKMHKTAGLYAEGLSVECLKFVEKPITTQG